MDPLRLPAGAPMHDCVISYTTSNLGVTLEGPYCINHTRHVFDASSWTIDDHESEQHLVRVT